METEQLAQILARWQVQPSAEESQAFLAEHATELLGDEAEEMLRQQLLADPNDRDREMFLALLVMARRDGIDVAYQSIREEMQENARARGEVLFSQFVQVGDLTQLAQYISQLTPQDMDLLEAVAVQQLAEHDESSARGIQQRLDALRGLRQGVIGLAALEEGLLNYLRAATDSEALAMLQERSDLLLTDEAQQALANFRASDPRAQAQLDRRRWLWKRARRTQQGEDGSETGSPDDDLSGPMPIAEPDELDLAIDTLLTGAVDEESFDELVERLPILTGVEALARLAERAEFVYATGNAPVAVGMISLLIALLDPFYARHEELTAEEGATLDGLWNRLIPISEDMGQPAMVEALRAELTGNEG